MTPMRRYDKQRNAEIARLLESVAKLEAALRAVQWKSVGLTRSCEACGRFVEYGHTADCIVGQALRACRDGGVGYGDDA